MIEQWNSLNDHAKRKEYKRARKILELTQGRSHAPEANPRYDAGLDTIPGSNNPPTRIVRVWIVWGRTNDLDALSTADAPKWLESIRLVAHPEFTFLATYLLVSLLLPCLSLAFD